MSAPVKEDPRLISFNALRKAVGWLGILLPAALLTCNLIFGSCSFVQDSISHYYYTVGGNLFVGILCAVALFLLSYKGYPDDKRDKYCASGAGIAALGIAFFPTNDNSSDSCAIIHYVDSPLRNGIHYGCAVIFFLLLAYMSFFLFTKSKGHKTGRKLLRNKVYRICGVFILVFIALIALYGIFDKQLSFLDPIKPIFIFEWGALISFGSSWLIKGELFLADQK